MEEMVNEGVNLIEMRQVRPGARLDDEREKKNSYKLATAPIQVSYLFCGVKVREK
jgi:hypothetical protein